METIKQKTLDQIELIMRLNKWHSKKVKIKLIGGAFIEGRLTGLQPALTAHQFEKGEWSGDFNSKVCYVRVESGTITIPYGNIADIESLT